MPPDGALRKNQKFKVQSLTPNVCLTPVGGIPTPVPYFCFEEGLTANETATSVRFTGEQAFTMASHLQSTKNDAPGTAGGIVSGTFGSICEPIEGLSTIRACGHPVCRDRHLFWINSRNALGLAYYDPVPLGAYTGGSGTGANSNADGENVEKSGSDDGDSATKNSASGENGVPKEKSTDFFNKDECDMSGGSSDMTPDEFESLETIEQENAKYADRFFNPRIDDVSCDDPGSPFSPHQPDGDDNSCPFRHCQNNCLQTRHGIGGEMVADLGSSGMETLQQMTAIGWLGTSDSTYSAGQAHDLECSNPAGRELGSRGDLEGESCERLCAIELGGFKYKHTGDGAPSKTYETFEWVKEVYDSTAQTVQEAAQAVQDTVDAVTETAEQLKGAYDKAKSVYDKLAIPGIPLLR